jgi:hypothetical protein
MKNNNSIRVILGSLKEVTSSNNDLSIPIDLETTNVGFVEGDKTTLLNLEQRFDDERQLSDRFRIAGKITNIFNNTITGTTQYTPFRNGLYYVNPKENIVNQTPNSLWAGYPQYDEFSFYRTTMPENHVDFEPKSGGTYNWSVYLSYPSSNNTSQIMTYTDPIFGNSNTFVCSDGIPYVIKNRVVSGKRFITFYCGTNHNLSVGEFIKLNVAVNGREYFEVNSLGDEALGNEDKVFSTFDYGYDDPNFYDGTVGTLKRVININNTGETTSKYYVREHKILTSQYNINVTKMGFEHNPFPVKKKLEYRELTPNLKKRISTKEDNQTISYTFSKDIHINPITTNLGRPISEIFVTIIHKGYSGWFGNSTPNKSNIQTGWDFNFQQNTYDNWWRTDNPNNQTNITKSTYNVSGVDFYYNNDLNVGDTLLGDFCEFNEYEQQERIISKQYHKYSFNPNVFQDNSPMNEPGGYLYSPHYSIPIRVFSDYIETARDINVEEIPDYSFYSETDNQWRWRDMYTYGYIDSDGNGVDFPFLNNTHYPFKEIIFLQTPINRNVNNYNSIIFEPIIDDCE